jgi:hypothetical protein
MFVLVTAQLSWPDNCSGVYLVNFSLSLIGQQGLEDFSYGTPCNGRENLVIRCQSFLVMRRKQAKQLLSLVNHTPIVTSYGLQK